MRLETSDGKMISTDLHGLIDYGAGALALVVSRALGGSDAAIAAGNIFDTIRADFSIGHSASEPRPRRAGSRIKKERQRTNRGRIELL